MDGLDYLLTEAAYTNKAKEVGTIKYEDIPGIRSEAVELARCLSDLGDANNEVVRRWLEAASADPLPEVRRAAELSVNTFEE